jgi:hypothetical protein
VRPDQVASNNWTSHGAKERGFGFAWVSVLDLLPTMRVERWCECDKHVTGKACTPKAGVRAKNDSAHVHRLTVSIVRAGQEF